MKKHNNEINENNKEWNTTCEETITWKERNVQT